MKDVNYSVVINDTLRGFVEYAERGGSTHGKAYYIHVNKWINGYLKIGDRKDITHEQRVKLIIFSRLFERGVCTLIDSGEDYHSIKELTHKCLRLAVDIYISRQHVPQLKVIKGGLCNAQATVQA